MSFKAVAARIAQKDNVPQKNANAILAAASRNASPVAKKKNPALNKVKGSNKDIAARMLAARRKGKGKGKPLMPDSDSDFD